MTTAATSFGIGSRSFQGLEFTDLDYLPGPAVLVDVLATSSKDSAVDQSRISFGDDFISLDLQRDFDDSLGSYSLGDTVQLDLTFVPEPSAVALWAIVGLIGGIIAWRGRR